MASDRALRSLRPNMVAPTVLAFQEEAETVLAALRKAGYLPVPADETGAVSLGRPPADVTNHSADTTNADADIYAATNTQTPATPTPATTPIRNRRRRSGRLHDLADFDDENTGPDPGAAGRGHPVRRAARDAVSVRELTQTEEQIEAFGPHLATVERRQLAFAVENQVPVSITYRSSTGGTTTRTISEIELVNGLLYAFCHLRDDDRVFAIDRIQAVTPVSGR